MSVIEGIIIICCLISIIPIIKHISKLISKDALDEIYYFKKITKENKNKYIKLNKIINKSSITIYMITSISFAILALIYSISLISTSAKIITAIVLTLLITLLIITELINVSFKLNVVKKGIEYKIQE